MKSTTTRRIATALYALLIGTSVTACNAAEADSDEIAAAAQRAEETLGEGPTDEAYALNWTEFEQRSQRRVELLKHDISTLQTEMNLISEVPRTAWDKELDQLKTRLEELDDEFDKLNKLGPLAWNHARVPVDDVLREMEREFRELEATVKKVDRESAAQFDADIQRRYGVDRGRPDPN